VPLPVVAIVGRPNVGKSTLFNRLVGRHVALVHATAGVTRDRHYGTAEWLGCSFRLVDTGGIMPADVSSLMRAVQDQTTYAISEADVILFMVDARQGVTAADEDLASRLRKAGTPVMLLANKVESEAIGFGDVSLYRLGFGDPLRISAEHGRGVGDMLDVLVTHLPETSASHEETRGVQVAIVGRPNVGKSSLINFILGEHRHLVTEIPGTTRDAIDSLVRVNKKFYTLIDTAGMRKPRRIGEVLEQATVTVALQHIRRCDVAVLMLDAVAGIGEQDVRIGSYIDRHGKACVLALNKWDAVEKDSQTYEAYVARIHEAMPFLAHAPILSLSARFGRRVSKLFPLLDAVLEESCRRIPVAALNAFLKEVTQQRPAPMYRGKFVKFSFLTQTAIRPPTFLLYTNRPEGVAQHYQRYLERQLRQHYGFAGTPLRLYFRKKHGRQSGAQ
jgi:GTP-binding protein